MKITDKREKEALSSESEIEIEMPDLEIIIEELDLANRMFNNLTAIDSEDAKILLRVLDRFCKDAKTYLDSGKTKSPLTTLRNLLASLNKAFIADSMRAEESKSTYSPNENYIYIRALIKLSHDVTDFMESFTEMVKGVEKKPKSLQPDSTQLSIYQWISQFENTSEQQEQAEFIVFLRKNMQILFDHLKHFQKNSMVLSSLLLEDRENSVEADAAIIVMDVHVQGIQEILAELFHTPSRTELKKWIVDCLHDKKEPGDRPRKLLTDWFVQGKVNSQSEQAFTLEAVVHGRQAKKIILDLLPVYYSQGGMNWRGKTLDIRDKFSSDYNDAKILSWFYEYQHKGSVTINSWNARQCPAIGQMLNFMGTHTLRMELTSEYKTVEREKVAPLMWQNFFDVVQQSPVTCLDISFKKVDRYRFSEYRSKLDTWSVNIFKNLPKGLSQLNLNIDGLLEMSDEAWQTVWDGIKVSELKSLVLTGAPLCPAPHQRLSAEKMLVMSTALKESGISCFRIRESYVDKTQQRTLARIVPEFSASSKVQLMSGNRNILFNDCIKTREANTPIHSGPDTAVISQGI